MQNRLRCRTEFGTFSHLLVRFDYESSENKLLFPVSFNADLNPIPVHYVVFNSFKSKSYEFWWIGNPSVFSDLFIFLFLFEFIRHYKIKLYCILLRHQRLDHPFFYGLLAFIIFLESAVFVYKILSECKRSLSEF